MTIEEKVKASKERKSMIPFWQEVIKTLEIEVELAEFNADPITVEVCNNALTAIHRVLRREKTGV